MSEIGNFLLDNWEPISIAIGVYETAANLAPTKKNRTIIGLLRKIPMLLKLINRRKGGGSH